MVHGQVEHAQVEHALVEHSVVGESHVERPVRMERLEAPCVPLEMKDMILACLGLQ